MTLRITSAIAVEDDEIEISFIRSSGPGGQNVNKVASAVQLRFNAMNSAALPGDLKARLVPLAGSRLTKDGVIVISADRFRTQEANRRDALTRLAELLKRAAIRPKPRIKTRPTKSAKRQRVDAKTRRGTVKLARGKPADWD